MPAVHRGCGFATADDPRVGSYANVLNNDLGIWAAAWPDLSRSEHEFKELCSEA
jgi:hypothetical protein